ncbi:hypothetical protein Bca52824_044955 [Brassica carinata]|uniref:PdxS/SNZ N-terminal domain-containing protein n=1 Tax=Brassica carinata TaxID=52824 RepID=A0A8X7UR32_BRACI|nr:hypothetical protein Bca52824_044955 [Brassica carinata]
MGSEDGWDQCPALEESKSETELHVSRHISSGFYIYIDRMKSVVKLLAIQTLLLLPHSTPLRSGGGLRRRIHDRDEAAISFSVKVGLAQMLRGGVIMDVVNAEQARIAEEAGACAVMARARSRRYQSARWRREDERSGDDQRDQTGGTSGSLAADPRRSRDDKDQRRGGTGNVVEAVRHVRSVMGAIRLLRGMDDDEVFAYAKKIAAPYELVMQTKQLGRLPVVQFAAGGVATPADAALMMQLGCDGVFVGSGIFKSGDPAKRAKAIVQAVTNYRDAAVLAEVSCGLGEAMVGINLDDKVERFANRSE